MKSYIVNDCLETEPRGSSLDIKADVYVFLIFSAKVIKWSQLLALLDSGVNQPSVMKALQQVAVLIQGCWVIKSEILHPKDSFSAHNSSPAEIICRARDFVVRLLLPIS